MTAPPFGRCGLPTSILILLLANALPEIVLSLADAGVIGNARWRSFAVSYGGLWQGLWKDWRANFAAQPVTMLLSYSLIHTGIPHALGNLLAIWFLARPVLRKSGASVFWITYVASVLFGALAYILMSNSPQPVIGASGGIYGLATAWIVLDWQDRQAMDPRALPRALLLIAALLAFNAFNWWIFDGQLAWQTHLGGMLGSIGLLYIGRSSTTLRR